MPEKCDNPNCGSDRLAFINGKTSDMCQVQYKDIDRDGCVPDGIGITDEDSFGDYIRFELCFACGKVQGKFPIPEKQVREALETK